MDRLPMKWFCKFTLAIFLLSRMIPISSKLSAGEPNEFSPERAVFSVKFREEVSPYRVMGVFVLPQEEFTLEALDNKERKQYILETSAGQVEQVAVNKWRWRAPAETGLYPVKIIHPQMSDSITLNIFVLVPYKQLKGEYLNDYRIGNYPSIPWRQLPIYKPPKGFLEVTKENEETFVSPHFKLKQFLCKQESGYPKYVVLRERLLLKLEMILEKVNERGYHCENFSILSGYRTPYYNKLIGNVKYSRHMWGGAADIFIDENPKDDMMDDLNQDGKINYRDAAIIYDIIDDMYGKHWYSVFVGGLGRYRKTESHGPFVHVDVRGFRARWGD
ncbi:MAG: hypothetical protein AMJ90_04095 [candidate division Zixibacteria bacterium SM23_73_2]|nr:MAG: hypothetical protein AMJ90_04095 [candidate division Zixibacteria bacterium SM23_73_2]